MKTSMSRLTAARLCASAFAACTASATLATPLALDPVVVVASRYEQPLSTTPASVTVLDEEALAPLATLPLDDILALHAGVSLARSGGPGQQASLFLRGTNSDSTLVLVDGVKTNPASFGGANLQNLRGADIARIEVVRGPRSTLYGSEAIGGVIAITTRRGAELSAGEALDRAALRLAAGSDATREARASASHHQADRHIALGIGDWRSDGDAIASGTDVAGAHRNTSGTLNASSRAGNTRYGIDLSSARGTTTYADCIYDLSYTCVDTQALRQDFAQDVVALWSETPLTETLALEARAGYAYDGIDQRESADHARTMRYSGSVQLAHHQDGNVLVAGAEIEHENVEALVYGSPLATDNDIGALFIRNDYAHGRQRFSLGARGTHYEAFGEELTGEASYGIALADTYGWLAAGRGFRAPDATERFGWGGNPDLEPERADSLEAGIRQRVGTHQFTVTGFVQRIEDLIDYPPPAWTATNIAEARITGTELGWSWQAGDNRIDAFATLQDPVDDGTGQRLPRRPEKQLSASASHRTGTVTWRVAVLAMDRRDNSLYDNIQLPGYAVVDLGVAWQVAPALNIDLRIENAGNIDYVQASDSELGDYRMPDRAFLLGVNWQAQSRYRR